MDNEKNRKIVSFVLIIFAIVYINQFIPTLAYQINLEYIIFDILVILAYLIPGIIFLLNNKKYFRIARGLILINFFIIIIFTTVSQLISIFRSEAMFFGLYEINLILIPILLFYLSKNID